MPGSINMGKAIIDPTSGKVRIGRKIDGFDALEVGQQLKEAKLAGIAHQKETIERNKTVIVPAIHALQTQVQTLHDDAVTLSNYLGALSTTSNAFKDLQSSVVKTGDFSQNSYVNVSIDNTVAEATTSAIAIRIRQLASVDSRITNTATVVKSDGTTPPASADDPLGIAGSFTINGGSTITITATDTLNTIIAAINNSSSNVQASYTQNGTNYYLILNGTNLATALTFVDGGNLLSTYFGINTTIPTDITLLQAQIQSDTIDGANGVVTKTYSFNTNTVTGLIPGVTLNLLSTTLNSSGTYDTLNISISENTSGVRDQILAFFNNYNDIRETLNRNTLTDSEGDPLDPKATMVGSPLIRNLTAQLNAIANFVLVGAGNDDYRIWQDIGIIKNETATDFDMGKYTLPDKNILLSALNTNFEKVKKLFGNYPVVSNSDFSVSDLGPSLDSSIAGKSIRIVYNRLGSSYYASFVCDDAGIGTGDILMDNQYNLVGPAGTVFSGITIGYSGADLGDGDSRTFTLTATQGLADRIAKLFDQTLDRNAGDFTAELARIKQKNDSLKAKIEKTEKEAGKIEKKWTAQAARLEATCARYTQFSRQLSNMFNDNKN